MMIMVSTIGIINYYIYNYDLQVHLIQELTPQPRTLYLL